MVQRNRMTELSCPPAMCLLCPDSATPFYPYYCREAGTGSIILKILSVGIGQLFLSSRPENGYSRANDL
jgi:hypothetical protein